MGGFEDVIARLRALPPDAGQSARDAAWRQLRPDVERRQSPDFVRQIDKLMEIGDVERATALLGRAPAQSFQKQRQVISALWPPIVCLVATSVFLGMMWTDLLDAQSSPLWPTTSGTVLESRVTSHLSGGGTKSGSTGHRVYRAYVRYGYTVNGEALEADRVTFDPATSLALAEDRVKRYPVGGLVTVHYKPTTPGRAVLETGSGYAIYVMLALAALMVVGSLVYAFFAWRGLRADLREEAGK